MSGYKKLEIYKKAYNLAIQIHKMSLKLPKHEIYEEGSQIRRSSKSIVSNIVEGYSIREYKADYIRSLYIAYAECEETIEHIKLLYDSGSLKDKNTYTDLFEQYNELGKMIFGFINSVKNKHKSYK